MKKIPSKLKCRNCKKTKLVKEFGEERVENMNGKYLSNMSCSLCLYNTRQAKHRTREGLIKKLFYDQIGSSKKRGHKPPSYTLEELTEWILKQKRFEMLYKNWVASKYDRWKRPSCDRLKNNLGYSFDNIRLVTWRRNLEAERERQSKLAISRKKAREKRKEKSSSGR